MTGSEERASDRLAIARLNDAFCHELDRGSPEGFARLFTLDAIYTNGPRRSETRDGVLAFARSRIAAGPRTSRHLAGGLHITFEGTDTATGISCCMAFTASGVPPITAIIPPVVADFHDVYRRENGAWLFAERHILPIFKPET